MAALRALADVAGGGGEEGRREVLRVGGSDLVQLLLETLAAAGVSGGSGPDEDEEDDIDIILSRVPEHARTVFQPQLPVAALEALLLLETCVSTTRPRRTSPRTRERSTRSSPPRARRTRARAPPPQTRSSPSCTTVSASPRCSARGEDRRGFGAAFAGRRVSRGDSTRGGRVRGRGGAYGGGGARQQVPRGARRRARCGEGGDPVVGSGEALAALIPRCWTLTTRDWIASPRSVPTDSPSDRSGCIRRASGM